MARGKKAAKAMTPEEKLAQALVPVDEQPYPIPENWCWTTVNMVSTVVTGGTPSKKNPDYYGDEFPFFKPTDLDKGRHVYNASEYLSEAGKKVARAIPAQSTAVCCIGSIGKCGYLEVEGTTNQQINSAIPKYNPLYLYYYMNTESFANELWEKSSATTIAIVNKAKMESCVFPLAPLAEQQRIVDRIESLFAKLDEAKEKVQAVLDGFELRKSAILHKAFTGELTEQWRKVHGVGLDSWETKRINEVAKPRAGYAFDSKKFTDSGYQIIRMGNLYGGELDLSRNPVYISENDVDETVLKRAFINKGDILITLTGTKYKRDYGYAVCITNPVNLLVNQRILCLTPSVDIERNYILYYLRSNIFRDIFFSNETGGVNQGNVSSKFVENIKIEVPSFAEQHEIVTVLDRLLNKEQQAKEAAESVLDQIDTMKKAILARAFRGELGTNDPAEESAVELLKRVI